MPTKLFFIVTMLVSASVCALESIVVTHYQKHQRYAYGAQLLELALGKLQPDYVVHSPVDVSINEGRGELEVVAGRLDLQWMSTNTRREQNLIAIRVPIYQWMSGLRLMLVKPERLAEMAQIRDVADLRQYTAAHGKHWGDLPVYAANQLRVSTLVHYEKLFDLVKLGRVDYFHRGLNEIWAERQRHRPALAIADKVMLFYPLPVYYFVTQSKPELAASIEQGLRLALADGSFKAHFLDHHQDFIAQGQLASRQLIRLENPDLPSGTPEMDTSWWLAPGP